MRFGRLRWRTRTMSRVAAGFQDERPAALSVLGLHPLLDNPFGLWPVVVTATGWLRRPLTVKPSSPISRPDLGVPGLGNDPGASLVVFRSLLAVGRWP